MGRPRPARRFSNIWASPRSTLRRRRFVCWARQLQLLKFLGRQFCPKPLTFAKMGLLHNLWGRMVSCGRLVIGQTLDHGNRSAAMAKPALTGLSGKEDRMAHVLPE